MNISSKTFVPFILTALLVCGCVKEQPDLTPRATKIPREYALHDLAWVDQYAYLANMSDPATRRYISAEKQYFLEQTETWDSDIRQMMGELNAQLSTSRKTTPLTSGAYEYYSKVDDGQQYPVFYRREKHQSSPWQVVIDLNELAGGADYYALGGFITSPDESTVAFTEDRTGTGRYTLRLKDLVTGEVSTLTEGVEASLAWHGSSVIAVSLDDRVVIEHTPEGKSVALYHETDPAFSLAVRNGRDRSKVLVTSESHHATEVRILLPDGEWQLVAPRQNGHRYRLLLDKDHMTALSNFRRPGYEIASVTPHQEDPGQWQFIELESSGNLVDFERSGHQVLVHLRNRLRDELVLVNLQTGAQAHILQVGPGESIRLMRSGDNSESTFRFRQLGLINPERHLQFNVTTKTVNPIGTQPAPGGYNPDHYNVEERWIQARDGISVPVTIIYKKGDDLAKRPMYLTAYGAYGRSQPLSFDATKIPLLNRGFILGLVHVRGGGELGPEWHEAGRHLTKENTFHDLIDVTTGLVAIGVGHPDLLAARGASAGGTTIGVVANEAPGLFTVLVAEVPFVDVMTTLLDPGLPLTASDILEWGDPKIPIDARYLFEFSPYQQVREQGYPHLLVQASANDGRVGIHEALKWMAKIREHNTRRTLQLIDIDENSGHLGSSDQYQRRRKQALEYAFVLRGLGLED